MVRMRTGQILLSTFLSIVCSPCAVEAQDLFANSYGGSGNEWAYSIQQTMDGGYAISGPSSSFGAGGYDYWIAKLDDSGSVMWQKTYGGSSDDIPNSMQQTTDGGYILAGRTQSFGTGGFDLWVLKLDASGNRVWQRTFGGSGNFDAAYSVLQAPDGGYLLSGVTDSFGAGSYDFWVIKVDSSGNGVWQKTLGGSAYDCAYASCLTSDGGFVVAGGGTVGAGMYDVWVIKWDSSGSIVWQKAYGGTKDDIAFAVQETAEGGFIVAGRTDSYGAGGTDFWVLKLDASGNRVWQKTYGGSALDWAFAVTQTGDGGYVVAGRTDSFGAGNGDTWILKLDASGNITWQRTYGGSGMDYAYAIGPAVDGSTLVGGVTASFGAGNYDAMVLKLEFSCFPGAVCPAFSLTSVTPGSPSPTATTTARSAASSSGATATTVPSSSNPAASRTVQCIYPILPDAGSVTLLVSKAGTHPRLSWPEPDETCAVTGYGIYRGTFPIVPYNHESLDCAVPGLFYVDSTSGDNQYYLVVPHNATAEGSYGTSDNGYAETERPPGSSACKPRCLLTCP